MVVTRVGPVSGAYATLQGFLNDSTLQATFEAASEDYYVELEAFTETSTLGIIVDWVSGPLNNLIFMPAAGEEHGGVPGAGYVLSCSKSNGYVLTVTKPYTTVMGLEFINTAGGAGIYYQSDHITISENIISCPSTVNPAFHGLRDNGSSCHTSIIRNNVVNADIHVTFTAGGDPTLIQNNTVNAQGIWPYCIGTGQTSGTKAVVINNACVNSTGDCMPAPNYFDPASDYNFTEDNSFIGANGGGNLSMLAGQDFVDPANGDYNVVNTGILYGAGDDLGSQFTKDITGATRG